MASYTELQVTTNFSFLQGASHPEELVVTAASLGLSAIGITDRNTLAGVVRAHVVAKQVGIRLVVGARLDLEAGEPLDPDALPAGEGGRARAAEGQNPEGSALIDPLPSRGREGPAQRGGEGAAGTNSDDDVSPSPARVRSHPLPSRERVSGAGLSVLCFPTDRAAYGRLSRLLSVGKQRAPKGECRIWLADLLAHHEGQIIIALPPEYLNEWFSTALLSLIYNFRNRIYLSANKVYYGDDDRRLAALAALAAHTGIPLVATNDIRMHTPARRPLQDVLTCIREHCTIREAGFRLYANAERHLKPPEEMARLFARYPDAIARTLEIAERCRFSLDELRYEYPVDPVPDGRTPQQQLVRLAWEGAAERYPEGLPHKVRTQVEHELALIEQLGFAPYFVTVHDIVRFARDRDILCQGRGSAANSAVCYCLGVTAVDPARSDLLFERFISAERNEPPDIDVDFEHERREEVIQYVYAKYGRDHAGMTATVICYRSKMALREVAKAFGLSEDAIVALQSVFWRRQWDEVMAADVASVGLDPLDPTLRMIIDLAGELIGFPRHLSQHTGGMVITKSPLDEVVPIENAAMPERTVIEWDKEDLDALGILKIDILALGMLTCVRKAFELIARQCGRRLTLASVPAEDPAVYDMLCEADSVGVFQVESRAQMTMLPRLKPRCFYDLVIEVAIVRPGPIQGDMVHPYLRRRRGEEPVEFPSEELADVLGKTLGVPLFQEQAMKIAIVAAGFTPTEADALRRAMATFRRSGTIHGFRDKFIQGMIERGYKLDFSQSCFQQIEGFADYGFPESHSASFALIVYISAWLKCHYPAVFACALLNSQPMGFYAPAQIIGDARRHGVEVRPVDVNFSDRDCTLEPLSPAAPPSPARLRSHPLPSRERGNRDDAMFPLPVREREGPAQREGEGHEAWRDPADAALALRLGFRQVKGLAKQDADAIATTRGAGYSSIADFARRTGLGRPALETLAAADAFGSLGLDRRRALWQIGSLDPAPLPLFATATAQAPCEPDVMLRAAPLGEQVADDYRVLRLSLKAHPVALLRHRLARDGYLESRRIAELPHGRPVKAAGVVVTRQRPGSANGVIFITLEDETGNANLIVWPKTFERFRRVVLQSTMIGVEGPVQRDGIVVHVLAERLAALDRLLGSLSADIAASSAQDEAKFHVHSRDFH
jgi:error-prone DNA polymerase